MLDISSKSAKTSRYYDTKGGGGEIACKVDVEYELVPPKYTSCMTVGHSTVACPTNKLVRRPRVSVYVQHPVIEKRKDPPPNVTCGDSSKPHDIENDQHTTKVDFVKPLTNEDGKGKEFMIYNSFDALMTADDGLNRRDHQVAVADLVSEFRLQFLGLLEVRVSTSNCSHIQLNFLPRWKWFIDHSGPGNRTWIAWYNDNIDVVVLDVGSQFIYCRLIFRCLHEHVFVTVVYGANDVGVRRMLWQELGDLAQNIVDKPWLICGDFNVVLDMSEVCGAFGDIWQAMEEFKQCVTDTGLITLPMQGELFTWHNSSADSRSLWKRLDPMIVKDSWLGEVDECVL
ncbi:UNVERIFIED_CONTAM: hypothetical protein Sradi_5231500, partial [Sesamum radiatum]